MSVAFVWRELLLLYFKDSSPFVHCGLLRFLCAFALSVAFRGDVNVFGRTWDMCLLLRSFIGSFLFFSRSHSSLHFSMPLDENWVKLAVRADGGTNEWLWSRSWESALVIIPALPAFLFLSVHFPCIPSLFVFLDDLTWSELIKWHEVLVDNLLLLLLFVLFRFGLLCQSSPLNLSYPPASCTLCFTFSSFVKCNWF